MNVKLRPPNVRAYGRVGIGLAASATGTVMTLRARSGIAPWDVFHQGLSIATPLNFGQAVIVTSVFLVGISWMAGIHPGVATVVNMLAIGVIDNVLLGTKLGSTVGSAPLGARITILVCGLVLMGFGSAVYVSAGLGAGPRDSFQLALSRKFGIAAGLSRLILEGAAVGVGWILGGNVGWGTVIAVVILGPITQASFAILHLDREGRRCEQGRVAPIRELQSPPMTVDAPSTGVNAAEEESPRQ